MTDIQSVESIDVVEISRDVVAMSDVIYPPDERPLHDPRVRLHIEDGRNFLQTTRRRYDLITGEPPPPLTPGTVNLYTREYFQLAYDRLATAACSPTGCRWPAAVSTDVKAIIRAFCDVFADCSLWNGTPLDWVLIGTRAATGPIAEAQFAKSWADKFLSHHLREIGFERPEQIGATFLGDADVSRGPHERHAAAHRQLSSATPSSACEAFPATARLARPGDGHRFRCAASSTRLRAREAFKRSPFVRGLWPASLIDETLPFFEQQRAVNRLLLDGASPLRHIEELDALITGTSLQKLTLWALGSDDVQQGIAADERRRLLYGAVCARRQGAGGSRLFRRRPSGSPMRSVAVFGRHESDRYWCMRCVWRDSSRRPRQLCAGGAAERSGSTSFLDLARRQIRRRSRARRRP